MSIKFFILKFRALKTIYLLIGWLTNKKGKQINGQEFRGYGKKNPKLAQNHFSEMNDFDLPHFPFS